MDIILSTAQERSDHIAKWIEVTEKKQEKQKDISGQVGPKLGRPESGVSAAARELGVSETSAKRAKLISGISEDAKREAPPGRGVGVGQ